MEPLVSDLDTEVLERFALANNHEEREQIVSQLVPGSRDHVLLQALVSEQAGYPDSWEEKRQQYTSYHDIQCNFDFRKEIKEFDPSLPASEGRNKTIIDRLRKRMNVSTSVPPPPEKPDLSILPTRVDYSAKEAIRSKLDKWSPKKIVEMINRDGSNGLLIKEVVDILMERDDLIDVLHFLVRREGPPVFLDSEKRVAVVESALKAPAEFGSLNDEPQYDTIFNNLTTDELKKLSNTSQGSSLHRNRHFVENRLLRTFSSRIRTDYAQYPEVFDEAWAFISNLAPTFSDLKLSILYSRLKARLKTSGTVLEAGDLSRSPKKLKKSEFFQYLTIPRYSTKWNQLGDISRKYGEAETVRLGYGRFIVKRLLYVPTEEEEKELVMRGLHEVLAHCSNDQATVFTEVIEEKFLNNIHAEAKLLSGNSDLEWVNKYGSSNVHRLAEQTQLEFSPRNNNSYALSDKVVLNVRVKNVGRLDISVYEINTLNYYKEKKEEISTDIDIEGMVPNSTMSIDVDLPQLVLQEREVPLPILDECKRGVYLVELSGGGQSTRAIIRKGSLKFLYHHTVAGTAVSILDEYKQPIASEKVLLHCMGETFDARSGNLTNQGEILLPPPPQSKKSEPIIADVTGSSTRFAALFRIDLPEETYTLESNWFFERECLTSSCNSLPILVRPKLLQGSQRFPVSLDLLEDPCITVTWCTAEGGRSREELPNVKLRGNFDLEALARVPVNATSLVLQLVGYVRPMQNRQKHRLQSEHHVILSGISQKKYCRCFHLKFVDESLRIGEEEFPAGYRLYCLGKDGECCYAEVDITPDFGYKPLVPFISPIRVRTNDHGFVSLGTLEGVSSIQVSPMGDQSCVSNTRFELRSGVCELYSSRFYTATSTDLLQTRIPTSYCPSRQGDSAGERPTYKLFRVASDPNIVTEDAETLIPLVDDSNHVQYSEDERMLNVSGLSEGVYHLSLSNRNPRAIGPVVFTIVVLPGDNVGMDIHSSGSVPALYLSNASTSGCSVQLLNAKVTGSTFEEAEFFAEVLWNTSSTPRVHLLSTVFEPRVPLFGDLSHHTLFDQFSSGECLQQEYISTYSSSNVAAVEERYVSERRVASGCFTGTRLSRPSLLAVPVALTEKDVSVAPASVDFIRGGATTGKTRTGHGGYKPMASLFAKYHDVAFERDLSHEDCTFDFLAQGTPFSFNMVPSVDGSFEDLSRGVIRIPLTQLLENTEESKMLSFLVTARECSIAGTLPVKWTLGEQRLPYSRCPDFSVALKYPLDLQSHFVRQRKAKRLDRGSRLEATYMSDSKLAPFTCLPDAFRLLDALNPVKDTFSEFTFLSNWATLTHPAKLEKYSRFACNELHFFLFRKDPEFFDGVVKPLISCKRAMTLADRYLLGHNLLAYTDIHLWNSMNAFEKCLVIDWTRRNVSVEKAKELFRALADDVVANPTPETVWNDIFEHAFASSDAMEGAEEAEEAVSDSGAAGPLWDKGDSSEDEEEYQLIAQSCADSLFDGDAFGAASMELCTGASPPPPAPSRSRAALKGMALQSARAAPTKMAPRKEMKKKARPRGRAREGAAVPIALAADASEEEEELDEDFVDLGDSDLLQLRDRHFKQFYQPVEKTKELAESQYYRISPRDDNNQTATIVTTEFWRDLAEHCANYDLRDEFVSENFPLAAKNINVQLLALALLDMPFQRPSYQTTVNESRGTIKFNSPSESVCVIFNQEILRVEEANAATGVVCGRTYFDPFNKTKIHNGKAVERTLSPADFIPAKQYGCQVVITNITAHTKNVDILLQIPEGSVCVGTNFVTRVVQKSIPSFSTSQVTYNFYFPEAGTFSHYPVQVSEKKQLVACSNLSHLTVNADRKVPQDSSSWEYLCSYGERSSVRKPASVCL
eukprot:gb/GECG01014569.1/.p1 GENE.gb/GECG01014569.1/~~gb/GECG01014569.1/.p1  ORF type:complete len:1880 (+),score=227.75 gb/GECG01014569.1/:1-5640(+)